MNLALRNNRENPILHNARNLSIGILSALFLFVSERPLAIYLTKVKLGVLPRLGLSPLAEIILSFLLLDYTLYLWHRLTHRSPLLWRFHRVHHADLDLTLTTGIRFHLGEHFFSLFWRGSQILLLGVSLKALTLWQTVTLVSVLFHHSNLRLPLKLEKWLHPYLVTPRMHGLHHSIKLSETNSNYSSFLSIWDRFHNTLSSKLNDPELVIGLPKEKPKSLTLKEFFLSPFQKSTDTQDSQNQYGNQRPTLS
jgi:sterol desaturase/sphingolipid hydroxylase (fatty acid hydroxylase superfamily)